MSFLRGMLKTQFHAIQGLLVASVGCWAFAAVKSVYFPDRLHAEPLATPIAIAVFAFALGFLPAVAFWAPIYAWLSPHRASFLPLVLGAALVPSVALLVVQGLELGLYAAFCGLFVALFVWAFRESQEL